MAEQHRATADEWACVKEYKSEISFSTILELLHRIEALEAAAKSNHPAKPDSSLVERVEDAICRNALPENPGFRVEARAAIRAVAAWLGTECEGHLGSGLHWAIRLEQEATR